MKPVVSQSARAYASLQDRLRDGSLKPGDRIDLAAIAAELGISRQPVRDALKLLEGESLVRSSPQVGFSVVAYTESESLDVVALHGLIECEVAELAAVRRTETQLLELRAKHHESRAVIEKVTTDRMQSDAALYGRIRELGRLFHHAVYSMTDSPDLEAIASASYMRYDIAFFRRDPWLVPREEIHSRLKTACHEHGQMLESLTARDSQAAREIAKVHESGRFTFLQTRLAEKRMPT